MKAYLMYPAQDFDLQQPLPANASTLTQDLELETLFQAMAQGDKFLLDVIRTAVLTGLNDPEIIRYRQAILQDCLQNGAVIRQIYDGIIEVMVNKRKFWRGIFSTSPGGILSESVDLLEMYMVFLQTVREIGATQAGNFKSTGFTHFFRMIQEELNDEYFATVQNHLKELQFRDGVVLSAMLGRGMRGWTTSCASPTITTKPGWSASLPRKRQSTAFVFIPATSTASGPPAS